jgi:hypothetical protein
MNFLTLVSVVVTVFFFFFILVAVVSCCCRVCAGDESEEIVQLPQPHSSGSRLIKFVYKSD